MKILEESRTTNYKHRMSLVCMRSNEAQKRIGVSSRMSGGNPAEK